jgi:selenocysteine-specific elongation factor
MTLVVGVIGHVDHGKTALVRALTGMETDRLPEEKRRGISIVLGFAHLPTAQGSIDLIDMPGHEKFVRTMVAGSTGLDAVLMVVAANEGIKPQTVEHVDIAGLLRIERAIVAVTKADLADDTTVQAVMTEAVALTRKAGIKVLATTVVSALTGHGVDGLRDLLCAAWAPSREITDDGFPYLPVDRAFTVAGHGTVVTGTLRRGPLTISDPVELVPTGRKVRLRGLQVHGARVTSAMPGQRVALNLRDVKLADAARGVAVAAPDLLTQSTWLSVCLRIVDTAPVLPNGERLLLLVGTEEVEARLRLLDRDAADPGCAILAQLRLTRPVSVPARERFVLRRFSPPLTIGGGRIIEPSAVRLRRGSAGVLERLRVLAAAEADEIVRFAVDEANARGVSVVQLARLAGLSPARVTATLLRMPVHRDETGLVVGAPALARTEAAVLGALAGVPAGLATAALEHRLDEASPGVIAVAIARLARAGVVRLVGSTIFLARDASRQAEMYAESARKLADAVRRGGLTPPEPASLAPAPVARRLVEHLIRAGVLVRAPDPAQGRDIIFHQEAVAEARRRLAPLLAPPGLLVKEAGAALGISRKFCVPLLEHLDEVKFTRRVADRRVLALNK